MIPWRIDGTPVIRRHKDNLLCGVMLHDGQAWITKAK